MTQRRLITVCLSVLALAFLVFTIWIIHEANIGRDNILFKTVRATPYGDKIGHFFLAGALTLSVNFFWGNRGFARCLLPYGSLLVTLMALAEESSQHYIATRNFDPNDALANLIGILVFSLPAVFSLRKKKKTQPA